MHSGQPATAASAASMGGNLQSPNSTRSKRAWRLCCRILHWRGRWMVGPWIRDSNESYNRQLCMLHMLCKVISVLPLLALVPRVLAPGPRCSAATLVIEADACSMEGSLHSRRQSHLRLCAQMGSSYRYLVCLGGSSSIGTGRSALPDSCGLLSSEIHKLLAWTRCQSCTIVRRQLAKLALIDSYGIS